MMGAIGSSVYDDQNGWGSYRLTLPVSKRDVVLSRYAAIATLGLIGSAVGFAASLAVMGLASAVERREASPSSSRSAGRGSPAWPSPPQSAA